METGRTAPARAAPTFALIVGLGLIGAYVSMALILIDRTSFDVWGAVLLAPILIGVSVPVLRRQAVRESDAGTFRLLLLALIVKLAGAVARYYVAFSVYGGAADAARYHKAGVDLAGSFRHLDLAGVHLVTGTPFIENATGLVYALIGPSKLGGFVFFSWLGFWGLYLFYRAFTIAVPLGRRRSYAHLLFFLPSLVFWPSGIGKEAWMMFSLGIAVYGVAKILTYATWRGILLCIAGLWAAGMVRPPMAALVAVSLAAAVVTRKSRVELRELAPIVKGVLIVVVVVSAAVLVGRSDRFLQSSGIDTSGGIGSTLTDVQSRTAEGGASFVPSIVSSPARAPLAAVTVLFRPFVFEAHNLQSLFTAIEGTALLIFCLLRFRWGWAALRSLRQQPFVVFCLVFSALFIVAFSSFANFGLLARERVQLYQLLLVLFSIPPATPRVPTTSPRSPSETVTV
jgi:hypothetical protein